MIVEIKERGKDSFYDEFLYVLSNYKNILNNPNKKVCGLSNQAIKLGIISIITLIIIVIVSILSSENSILNYIIYMFSFLFIFSIIYFCIIKKRIKELKSVKGTITLKFEEENIEYLTSNNNYNVKWKAIKYIIINKYSICFIPIDNTIPVIGVSRDYEDEVLKAIKEVKKEELIIRNSD